MKNTKVRFGLRFKLIMAFISIIVIPIIIFIVSSIITTMLFTSKTNISKQVKDLNNVQNYILESVTDNFQDINNYDKFNKDLESIIKKYNAKVSVVDKQSRLLYDSENKQASLNKEYRYDNKPTSLGIRFSSGIESNGRMVFNMPVVINDYVVADAVIEYDQNSAAKPILALVIIFVAINFGVLLLSIILLIIIFSKLISRSILVPLKELNSATENIANGNLDFEIKNRKKNELGRFAEAFDTMRLKLKESLEKQTAYENSRKELIASISHDLRTPITSIKGYVEGLKDGKVKDGERYERYLNVIHDKTNKLDNLIDDLFQFSQLELGKLNMEFEEVSSSTLLSSILTPIEIEFQEYESQLNIEKPYPDVTVYVDSMRISQIFDNIISNAKRYIGENGKIKIESYLEEQYLQICISDNGTGISPDILPYVFDRFYRGEKSRSREFGGTGLGLAICKQIIEDHGGQIWVNSVPGKGAAFYFTIPVIKQS